jgi:hypothetical protein
LHVAAHIALEDIKLGGFGGGATARYVGGDGEALQFIADAGEVCGVASAVGE